MTIFEAVDDSVHVASIQLRDAAAAGNTGQVLSSLGSVQRGCVSCHAQFRERLRTNR
jgi:cytochrome c556